MSKSQVSIFEGMDQLDPACPLCDGPAKVTRCAPLDTYECGNCGSFKVTSHTRKALIRDDKKHLVAGHTREQSSLQQPPVTFSDEEEISRILKLVPRDNDVHAKATKLFRAIIRLTTHPGAAFLLDMHEHKSLAYARDSHEMKYHLDYLRSLAWIDAADHGDSQYRCIVTPAGWQAARTPKGSESGKAFVAMSFDASLEEPYNFGIKLAVEDAGYKPTRVDYEEFNSSIDDKIIAEIKESRFLIADVTGHRNGVYYEAGFAMGLGLEVIWLCRDDDKELMHFDTRQLKHLIWKKDGIGTLREQLTKRILATIGRGAS